MSANRLTMPMRTTKPSALRAAPLSRGAAFTSGSVAQHAEFRGQSRVEQLQVFLEHALHQLVGVRVRHHEIHAHRFLSGELQEMRLVHHAVAAESGDGAERRAAADVELLRLAQQPVVEQHAVMSAALVHEEAQVHALGGLCTHAQFLIKPCAITKPSSVNASEPIRCKPIIASAHAYSCRNSSVTVSPENVEKVVSPPRKPVVMNSRSSGDSAENCSNAPSVKPMINPPSRLAVSVPIGMVGKIGFSARPNADRKSTRLNSSHPSIS